MGFNDTLQKQLMHFFDKKHDYLRNIAFFKYFDI